MPKFKRICKFLKIKRPKARPTTSHTPPALPLELQFKILKYLVEINTDLVFLISVVRVKGSVHPAIYVAYDDTEDTPREWLGLPLSVGEFCSYRFVNKAWYYEANRLFFAKNTFYVSYDPDFQFPKPYWGHKLRPYLNHVPLEHLAAIRSVCFLSQWYGPQHACNIPAFGTPFHWLLKRHELPCSSSNCREHNKIVEVEEPLRILLNWLTGVDTFWAAHYENLLSCQIQSLPLPLPARVWKRRNVTLQTLHTMPGAMRVDPIRDSYEIQHGAKKITFDHFLEPHEIRYTYRVKVSV